MKISTDTRVLQGDAKITVDESVAKRYSGKVLFQHKIDRLLTALSAKELKTGRK